MSLRASLRKNVIEAGCDEAGRGCLAGPVCAAAVVLPPNYQHPMLNDSKQLSHKKRLALRKTIEHDAIAYAVEFVNNVEIDQLNILRASITAMHRCLNKLDKIEHIIVDGNRFYPYRNIPYTCIVKGDSKFLSIAAASILAKTYRDEYMEQLHPNFPQYNWLTNKGYPTRAHREAIARYGITCYHRKSFQLLPRQTTIAF